MLFSVLHFAAWFDRWQLKSVGQSAYHYDMGDHLTLPPAPTAG